MDFSSRLRAVDLRGGPIFRFFQYSAGIIAGQQTRPMKDGQASLRVTMDPHFNLHIMVAGAVLGYLQFQALEGHTVVLAHHAFMLLTKNILQVRPDMGNKS